MITVLVVASRPLHNASLCAVCTELFSPTILLAMYLYHLMEHAIINRTQQQNPLCESGGIQDTVNNPLIPMTVQNSTLIGPFARGSNFLPSLKQVVGHVDYVKSSLDKLSSMSLQGHSDWSVICIDVEKSLRWPNMDRGVPTIPQYSIWNLLFIYSCLRRLQNSPPPLFCIFTRLCGARQSVYITNYTPKASVGRKQYQACWISMTKPLFSQEISCHTRIERNSCWQNER